MSESCISTVIVMSESSISIVMSESCISIVMSESCISIVMSESLAASGTMISKIVEESNTVLGSSQSIPGGMMGHPSTEPSEEGEQQLQAKRNEQVHSLRSTGDILLYSLRSTENILLYSLRYLFQSSIINT